MKDTSVRTLLCRLLGLLLVVALTATLPSANATSGPPIGPSGSAFYTPPAVLPDAPGDVVWYQPTPFYSAPLIRSNARAWKVLYRSTTALGEPVAVSGLVIVPDQPWTDSGPRPVVSFSPGTTGMGDRCAVSRSVTVPGADPTTLYEAPFITMLLQRGWAVAVTDYQGLGTPGSHTYVIGNALGRNSLDVVRAAQRLPVAGLSASAPVLIWGYSEGGNGAGWAAQLASAYAPELSVVAAAFGGVPNDLPAMFEFHENGLLGSLIAMGAIGLDTAYPELDLARYLNPLGTFGMDVVDKSCLSEALALSPLVRIPLVTTSNPIGEPAWVTRMSENKLSDRTAPAFPMYLYHGRYDEAVAFPQARDLRDAWCGQGADLTWRDVPGEHLSTYAALAPSAVSFLADRLEGSPTSGSCP